MAASTTARHMIDHHGGGNPIHCSRNSSSWIRIHMPSGMSRNTISNRRWISSSSPPATTRGACDGPAPGSSKRCLLVGLVGSAGRPVASSRPRLSPCGGLPSGYTGGLYNSTSCPRGAKSAHTQSNKQQMVSVSIHQTYALVYQNHSITQNIQVLHIPR
jgi:hypothetical protein